MDTREEAIEQLTDQITDIIKQIITDKVIELLVPLVTDITDAIEQFKNVKVLRLRTIKTFTEETGLSESYTQQLLREGQLTRYKINSSTLISMTEFDSYLEKSIKKVSTNT